MPSRWLKVLRSLSVGLKALKQGCHRGGKVTTRLRFLRGHIKTHIIFIVCLLFSVPLKAIFTSQIVNWCTLQTTGGVSVTDSD